MLLTFDLDSCQLIQAPGFTSPLTSLVAKRGDGEHLQLQFVRAGELVQLPGTSEMVLAVKRWGDFQGTVLAQSGGLSYDAVLQRYDGVVNYNTTALNTMLLIPGSETIIENESTSDLMLEVLWRPLSSTTWTRSVNTVRLTLANNVWRGSEEPPTGGTTTEILPSDYLVKERVIEYLPLCTGLTGGGVSNLDGTTTTAATRALNSTVALIDNTDGVDMLRVYELVSGSTAEAAPSVIRPDDYHATTNARVWRLRSALANYDPATSLTKLESIELVNVVGLTGGSGKLDGILTAAGAKPLLSHVAFPDNYATGDDAGVLRIYVLLSSTAAENPPFTVRPDDYHATTNARVWYLRTSPNAFRASRYWQRSQTLGCAADGLTGGNVWDGTNMPSLDGIPTADGALVTGSMVLAQYMLGGVTTWGVYILATGTDAEAAPAVIRPDDYHATTNARVWKRQKAYATPEIVAVPAAVGSTGAVNQIAFNSTHLYVCTATNTWRRAALSTW